jgi:hypoxanthine phosphoribosyltransferase
MSDYGFLPPNFVPGNIPGMPAIPGGTPTAAFELSWDLFGELCRALALRVYREYDPDIVVGIATAGVIPAAVIADILQVDFYSMKITRNVEGRRASHTPMLLSTAPVQAQGQKVLLVDEITTSGDTMRIALAALREVMPEEIRTATCFCRPSGFAPDYHSLATDDMIVFPWDRQIIEEGRFVVHPLYRDKIGE